MQKIQRLEEPKKVIFQVVSEMVVDIYPQGDIMMMMMMTMMMINYDDDDDDGGGADDVLWS